MVIQKKGLNVLKWTIRDPGTNWFESPIEWSIIQTEDQSYILQILYMVRWTRRLEELVGSSVCIKWWDIWVGFCLRNWSSISHFSRGAELVSDIADGSCRIFRRLCRSRKVALRQTKIKLPIDKLFWRRDEFVLVTILAKVARWLDQSIHWDQS